MTYPDQASADWRGHAVDKGFIAEILKVFRTLAASREYRIASTCRRVTRNLGDTPTASKSWMDQWFVAEHSHRSFV